jgi:hypothetical protein
MGRAAAAHPPALLALAVTAAGSTSKVIRGVEDDLPDHRPAG